MRAYYKGSLVFTDTSIPDATTTDFAPYVHSTNGSWMDATINFGQVAFNYPALAAGYRILASNAVPSTSIRPQRHFDTLLYGGNGSNGHKITGLEFKPDLVWFKMRSAVSNHDLYDSVRGGDKRLIPNTDATEASYSNLVQSFNVDGVTLGTSNEINQNSQTFVAWCWKGGDTVVSNTDGDVTSQVSVNEEAGFSIVSFTTPSSGSGFSIGHGLSKAPEVILMKNRSYANNWDVYHHKNGSNPEQHRLILNSNTGRQDQPYLDDTVPTSTVFRTRTGGNWYNNGNNIIAYCWYSVPGYSKFGSFQGNGNANGPFVFTGFRPAMIFYKRIDASDNWGIHDNKRDVDNPIQRFLYPDHTYAEWTGGTNDHVDFLSNGFKIRNTGSMFNHNNHTIVYWAFAETPQTSPYGGQSRAR